VPSLPESFAASLDMTGELPRMRSGPAEYAGPAADSPSRYSDDMTMELPIFSELESAWFRPPDAPAAPTPGWPGGTAEPAGESWSADPAMAAARSAGARRGGGSEGAGGAPSEVSWRTAADEGWQAAQAATELHDGGNTEMGLPRRVPMAQLVPGGVETATGGSDRRTPDAVRGLLSAYTRGVQRGRSAHGGTTDAGSSSSGKEQEA
jgi:hypothetical protein